MLFNLFARRVAPAARHLWLWVKRVGGSIIASQIMQQINQADQRNKWLALKARQSGLTYFLVRPAA